MLRCRHQRLGDLVPMDPAQHQVGGADRGQRGQCELRQPLQQRRHVLAVHHQIGRIGNGQHEAGRIGDERADEQVGQRVGTRRPAGGVDRGGQHHGRGIVGQKHRHQRADQEHQIEQAPPRAARMPHRIQRQPVEQAFATGKLGQHHHADQEQIDVTTLGHRTPGHVQRYRTQQRQQCGSPQRPHVFRNAERTEQQADRGHGHSRPDQQG
ncbi:hypothetical protein G6F68_013943 [Rhizopus microsporus]|nr:hypothetical protein G6F68_013943 [Rhizopus microsporus]